MKKRTLVVLVVLLLLLGVGSFTYARYVTTYTGKGTAEIAKWAVQLKDGDAALSEQFNLDLELEESDSVAPGKIAPGISATAKLQLDFTGTEVSTDTNFSIYTNELPTGITVKRAEILQNGQVVSELNVDRYGTFGSLIVPYDETNKVFDIEIEVEWSMSGSDASDTELGKTAGALEIPITVSVKQAD